MTVLSSFDKYFYSLLILTSLFVIWSNVKKMLNVRNSDKSIIILRSLTYTVIIGARGWVDRTLYQGGDFLKIGSQCVTPVCSIWQSYHELTQILWVKLGRRICSDDVSAYAYNVTSQCDRGLETIHNVRRLITPDFAFSPWNCN